MSSYLDFLRGRDARKEESPPKSRTNYDRFREAKFAESKSGAGASEGILKPHTLSDIECLIDMLKGKKGIVVDLASEGVLTQRMLDFLSGAIYALGGNIHRIQKRIYIITPKGVKLMTDEKDDKESNKKNSKAQKAN